MGFVIWYRLEFRTDVGVPGFLRLSNDVLHGDLLLDAAVHTRATLGPHPSTFEITLWDLPLDNAKSLAEQSRARAGSARPLLVDIKLGYFDQPSTQQASVMVGAITEIATEVAADGSLLTRLKGMERAGYLLRRERFPYDKPGESSLAQIFAAIEAQTTVPVQHSGVTGTDSDLTISAGTALGVLGQIAVRAGTPLAVRAGEAVLGPAPAPPRAGPKNPADKKKKKTPQGNP